METLDDEDTIDVATPEPELDAESFLDTTVTALKAIRDDAVAAFPSDLPEVPVEALQAVANEAIVGTLRMLETNEEVLTHVVENPGSLSAAYFDEINT